MPRPKVDVSDRLAPFTHARKGPGFYFVCKRAGHRNGVKKYSVFIPGKKTDAIEHRNAHDVAHHSAQLRHLGIEPERPAHIPTMCAEYLKHSEALEVDGVQDSQTTRFHRYVVARFILPGFAALHITDAKRITPRDISSFVKWAKANTDSKGAAIVDAISQFKTIVRWFGFGSIADNIKIPLREIRPKRQPKRDLDATTIRRLVAAMPNGSLEEALAYLKAGTGLRDIEIYSAVPEEFEFDVPIESEDGSIVHIVVWEPTLRTKGGGGIQERRIVCTLTPEVAAKVTPWVLAAAPGQPVFRDDECRGVPNNRMRERMRARIRAASLRAGIVTIKKSFRILTNGKRQNYETFIGAIDSIAPIRHEVVTLVKENISLEAAAEQAGHVDTSTTRKWYLKDRRTKNQLLERWRAASVLHRAIPLGGGPEGGPLSVPDYPESS
jgi:hypothetical protein